MLRTLALVNVWLTLATLLGWAIYEGLALVNGVDGDTISELVWHFVRARPFMATVLCILLGILLGHLFWQENRDALSAAFRRLLDGPPNGG